ncbi:MAG TPA: DUF6624 domain-containing protein [Candidatus Kapabacteria bacterium]|nr:DUF6624 domain-containing protein [Candidatus Kapabacteria bacterium]
MKAYSIVVMAAVSIFLSTASPAQHSKASHPVTQSNAKIISLEHQMKAAADSANYTRAASLTKEIIGLGQRDSSAYYTAALLLALSGNKAEGKLYYDTAMAKGYNPGPADMTKALLGLDNSPANVNIDSAFDAIHADAVIKSKSLPPGYKNAKLYELYSEDQGERMLLVAHMQRTGQVPMPVALKMNGNDVRRKKELYDMLSAHTIITANDLEEAGLILQHGDDTSDYWTAHQLALQAIALGDSNARQLAAMTLDRYLVKQGKPQHFGTQAFQNEKTGKWELYPVDPTVTDAERARWDEPPLKEQLKRNIDIYGASPKQ